MTERCGKPPEIVGTDAEPMPITLRVMAPDHFAARCREIIETMHGHEAHRELDRLTNQILDKLGYSEGIAIFKIAVEGWHDDAKPYPYWASGERNGMAKLNPEKVRQIRQSNEGYAVLAARFNVSKATIGYVRQRLVWKNVP